MFRARAPGSNRRQGTGTARMRGELGHITVLAPDATRHPGRHSLLRGA